MYYQCVYVNPMSAHTWFCSLNLLQASIQKDAQHSLADFSLMGEDENTSLFDFEGENFRDKQGKGLLINLPQRERKRNYDVNA